VTGEQIRKTFALKNTEGGRGDRLNGVLDPAQHRRGHPDGVAGEDDVEDLPTMWSVFISAMKLSSSSEKGLNNVLRRS